MVPICQFIAEKLQGTEQEASVPRRNSDIIAELLLKIQLLPPQEEHLLLPGTLKGKEHLSRWPREQELSLVIRPSPLSLMADPNRHRLALTGRQPQSRSGNLLPWFYIHLGLPVSSATSIGEAALRHSIAKPQSDSGEFLWGSVRENRKW